MDLPGWHANDALPQADWLMRFFVNFCKKTLLYNVYYLSTYSNSTKEQMNQNIYKSLQEKPVILGNSTLSYPFIDQAAAAHGNLCLSVLHSLQYKFL